MTATCTANPMRRHRLAAARCEPNDGGVRDPLQPWRAEKLSDKQVAAAVDAALYLLNIGMPPMFDLNTLRAMWKAGHHQLVDDLRGGGR